MVLYARLFAASAVLFLSCALTVHADSYSYTFTDTTDAPAVTDFTYVSPVLITTTTTFVPTNLPSRQSSLLGREVLIWRRQSGWRCGARDRCPP